MRLEKMFRTTVAFLAVMMLSAAALAQRSVDNFIRESGLDPGKVAVLVVDIASGDTVAAHNVSAPLVPASIMKSVTIAALLQEAGPDYKYHTPVCRDGDIDADGTLHGNLVTIGSGDPALGSHVEPFGTDIVAEAVDALTAAGVKSIEGRLVADQDFWAGAAIPSGWAKADLSRDYGTGTHALNYDNNTRGSSSVADPSATYLARLRAALAAAGISVGGKKIDGGERVAILDHASPPLDEIMRSCMMRSDNMMAESMLRTYSKLRGGDGSTVSGAGKSRELWRSKAMPLDGVVLDDGSGLSRANRVTADFMGAMLGSMSDDIYYASFFPLAGREGTLKKFLAGTPLDSYIAMKTGSMTGIQCYAGYKLDEDYAPTHVVVIIANDIKGSSARMKKAAEKMLLDIFTGETNM